MFHCIEGCDSKFEVNIFPNLKLQQFKHLQSIVILVFKRT